uniref:Aldose 1-epimerase n=4 Tax=Clastoptera arizonana TaxID=38151 RepID=A0A1B6D4J7_9HEMI
MDLGIVVSEDSFGEDSNGHPIRRFTLTNENRMSVQVINYGATITCIKVADRKGNVDDVVLGFDDMAGYLSPINRSYYFGATMGRVANRIYPTEFEFNGQQISVTKNVGEKHLHGGFRGFDKVIWDATIEEDRVIMTYLSVDGEEGLPGAVIATTIFQLTADNKLVIIWKATVTKPTLVNISTHCYFNVAGHASGSTGLLRQVLTINADKYAVLDDMVPTGELRDVAGTGYDLRSPRKISDAMVDLETKDGYDINYCLNKSPLPPTFNFAARVTDPETGRYMEVHTDQPGMQVYTSTTVPKFKAKRGAEYGKSCAICFETQKYPNAVHIKSFPSIAVQPGKDYLHLVTYSFGTIKDNNY